MSEPVKRRYVESLDLIRALTIASVVGVHSSWYMADGSGWVSTGYVLSLLHFTRESFMAMTGFVLTYSLWQKHVVWKDFWVKRFKLVLFPYAIWSALYLLVLRPFHGLLPFLSTYGKDLLDGQAWFHLYYLLITMQFYLIMPLFLLLMRWARKHPWWVVGSAALFEVLLMAYDHFGVGLYPHGINAYTGEEVWTYTLYLVMGGVAAVHWDRVREWLKTHQRLVFSLVLASALVMEGDFALEWHVTHTLTIAEGVLQPAMVPWSFGIIVGLATLGIRYEDRRRMQPGRYPLIKKLADLSFGVYLFHPMLLAWWSNLMGYVHHDQASFISDAVTVAVVLAGSMILVQGISLTRLSPWIVGRAPVLGRRGRRTVSQVPQTVHPK